MFGLLGVDMVLEDGGAWLPRWLADCLSLDWDDAIYRVQVVRSQRCRSYNIYLRIGLACSEASQSPTFFVILLAL